MKVNVLIMLTVLHLVWIWTETPEQRAAGQTLNGPMSLLPVEVEEVDTANPELPSTGEPAKSGEKGQGKEDEANRFDSLPTPLEPAVVTEGGEPDELSTKTSKQSRLEVLNRPLSAFRITNLSRPPFVPRQSFTPQSPREISTSEANDLSSLSQPVTYCRRPLYFEDATLERCGYSDWVTSVGILTNVHSATQFMFDSIALPFRMIKKHPDELVRSGAE